jgi:hypothetical protein
MKIELEISDKNEHTSSPWWIIVDPRQNFKVNDEGVNNIAHMINGPFFSREEAESVLRYRAHHYSKNARVWCHSGYETIQYSKKVRF